MPPADWPPIRRTPHTVRKPQLPSRGRWFWAVLIAIIVVIFGARTWLSYYVDSLWFESLGYSAVFWKTLGFRWAVFAIAGAVTFLYVYGTFLLLKRAEFNPDERAHTILIGSRVVKLPVESIMRMVALGGALFIAFSVASVMTEDWQTFALYWNAPRTAGFLDPIFGRPLNFYLFTLPVWQTVSGWLLLMSIIGFGIALFFVLVSGGSRALEGYANQYDLVSWRGPSITFSFVL